VIEKTTKELKQMGKEFDREFSAPQQQQQPEPQPQPKSKQQKESSRASRLANLTLEDMMA
jgi:SET domain-containing protein